jgi:hypothetical protein
VNINLEKILSIGNSFSQDAQRYLHKTAKNEGVDTKCVNLYIGGCSLKRHYINILENNAEYDFEFNEFDVEVERDAVNLAQKVVDKM